MASMAMLRDSIVQIEQRYQRGFAALYLQTGMAAVDEALKGGLRRGAVHEFLGEGHDQGLCARPTRFIAQILARSAGPVIWLVPALSEKHPIEPRGAAQGRGGSSGFTSVPVLAGLRDAGLDGARLLCVEVEAARLVGTMEDVLRTRGVTAVVADLPEPLSLTASRRLHLAAEKTMVTGFVVHRHTQPLSPNSCWTRWRIGPARADAVRVGLRSFPSASGGLSLSLLRRRGGDALFWRVGTDHDASVSFPVAAPLAHDTLAQGASRSRPRQTSGPLWS
ncbi:MULTISPECIES: ImuA family protein [Asaia]|uniref:ImuA family protein n=1 Tax=Asaia TaxID=91914 RepID=UPI002553458E|nr:hypothetical protein [Asaia sp. HumB]MDL2171587.1 hypothetical protein [Asaia sp. HumB]